MGNSAQVARAKRGSELTLRHESALSPLRCQPGPGCRSSLSPMLRALHADAWAQHHLTHFLGLPDLAALHSACKAWFHWLEVPNARLVSAAPRRGKFTVRALQAFAQVAWVKPFATELFICVSEVASPVKGQRFDADTKQVANARHDSIAWYQLLRALPVFSQLSVLHLHYDESSDVELFSLAVERCFTALSLSLRELSLACSGVYGFSGRPTRCLMHHIAVLSRLEVLNVFADAPAGVSYSSIPYFGFQNQPMTMLRTLRFNPQWCRPMNVSLSEDLANMPSLTDLGWGSWDPLPRSWMPNAKAIEADTISKGIAAFVRTRMQAQLAGAAVPLLRLDLSTTSLTSAMWREISALISLTELTPQNWDLTEGQDEWLKLGSFPSLTALSIQPNGRFFGLDAKHVLNGWSQGVAQCVTLTSLSCTSLFVSASDLALIARRCTRLATLTFIEMEFQSLSGLRDASALTTLEFRHCHGDIRRTLPSLANLRRLVIHEARSAFSWSERRELNNALFVRMPALASGFVQCLERPPTP